MILAERKKDGLFRTTPPNQLRIAYTHARNVYVYDDVLIILWRGDSKNDLHEREVAKLLLVARDGPFALLDHVLDRLQDAGVRLADFLNLQFGFKRHRMTIYKSHVLRIRILGGVAEGNAPSGPRRGARPGYWKASPGDPSARRRSSLLSPSPWQSECSGMMGTASCFELFLLIFYNVVEIRRREGR